MPAYLIDGRVKLQVDLDKLYLWYSLNGLGINVKKYSQISFVVEIQN